MLTDAVIYLLVKPNGSKLWRLKYYIEGIEKALLAFGVYPEIPLKRAREKPVDAVADPPPDDASMGGLPG